MRTILAICFCWWAVCKVSTQTLLPLRVLLLDADSAMVAALVQWPENAYPDSASALLAVGDMVDALQEKGYLEASLDEVVADSSRATALLHLGPQYRWVSLQTDGVPRHWLAKSGYNARDYEGKPLLPERWHRAGQKLLEAAANEGHPFARLRLDSLAWLAPGQLQAKMLLEKGPLIRFEGLDLEGDAPVSTRLVMQHLGLVEGQVYEDAQMRQASRRLQTLPFVQVQGNPQVQFIGEVARLKLNMAPKPANRFDFIIGVLPNNAQTGKVLITGQLDALLYNTFGVGERLALRFEQLRPQTQQLRLQANYPYALGLPFGVEADFALYRRDTNFINIELQAGVQYALPGNKTLGVQWQRYQTNLLAVDSVRLAASGQLPDTLDVARSAFALTFRWDNLDYALTPRRGWDVGFGFSAGQRQLRRNQRIVAFGFESLYDSLPDISTQYRLQGQVFRYLPLGRFSVLQLGLRAGQIVTSGTVFANEQYRIGGQRLLRGFDEERIFAVGYAVANAEYRLLLGGNAFMFAFYDLGKTAAPRASWYQGTGAGIRLDTQAGLLGISLAIGRQTGVPFNLRQPKVHLGYYSQF